MKISEIMRCKCQRNVYVGLEGVECLCGTFLNWNTENKKISDETTLMLKNCESLKTLNCEFRPRDLQTLNLMKRGIKHDS